MLRMKRSAIFRVSWLLFVLLFVTLTACSKATRNPSTVNGSQASLQQSSYPHPSGWALPEQHGLAVQSGMQINTATCTKLCHGANPNVDSGPSCKKCHENWPHAQGWKNKEHHGLFIKQKGTATCATQCHGKDLAGGLSKVACNSCHSIYPHSKNFSEATQHGPLSLGQGKESCKSCHGAELHGADNAPSCFSCHNDNYPHAKDWAEKTKHGIASTKFGKKTCATACHGKDLAGGISNVSCSSCHSVYPHGSGFSNPEKHGLLVLDKGKDDCAHCHDVSSRKTRPQAVPACSSCHSGVYPHVGDWALKISHGTWVIKNGLGSCANKCHGEDLKGGDVQKSCDSCHTLWPNEHRKVEWKTAAHGKKFKNLGKSACYTCHVENPVAGALAKACSTCHTSLPKHDDLNWKTIGHGSFVTQSGTNECKSCHGSVTEEFCSKCHASYPAKHTSDWKQKVGGHNNYIKGNLKGDGNECRLCHGQDLKGGAVVKVGCVSCHGPGKTPHQPGKQESMCETDPDDEMAPLVPCVIDIPFYTTHGKDAKKSSKLCTICHGLDYYGGISGKSCFTCHDRGPFYPHNKNLDWSKSGNHGVAYTKKTSNCTTACHGSDLLGGLSGVSCAKCHDAFPHDIAINFEEHGKNLLAAPGPLEAKYNLKCGICHGVSEKLTPASYALGHVTPLGVLRCTNCHQAYPHFGFKGMTFKPVDIPWKPSGHAAYVYYSSDINTSQKGVKDFKTGCGGLGVSSTGCHDNPARKGPLYTYEMGNCTTYCHK